MSDWRPKLIASDMDGTLLHWDDTVSEETLAELARWRAEGVPLVLATGRPPRWMRHIREVLGHGTAVCCNGAVLLDLDRFEIVEEELLRPEILQSVTGELRRRRDAPIFSAANSMRSMGRPAICSRPTRCFPGRPRSTMSRSASKYQARPAARRWRARRNG